MHGTVAVDISADITAVQPVVTITGGQFPPEFAVVSRRSATTGIVPSTAEILIRGIQEDDESKYVVFSNSETGPLALRAGTRFQITEDGTVVFNGGLIKRADLSRSLRLVVADDRSILRRLPMHGTVNYDFETDVVKFNASRPLRYNPFGAGNCVEVMVDDVDWPVPLHTWIARADATLAATPYDPTGSADPEYTFWTPLRMLRNLWYRINYDWKGEGYDGLTRLPPFVLWAQETLQYAAGDMGKKLPDTTIPAAGPLAARSVAGVLSRACNLAGVIDWRLDYLDEDKSTIVFFSTVETADEAASDDDLQAKGAEITVQNNGIPTDSKVAFDWAAEDDWSETVFRAWVEGKPLAIESQFATDAADPTLEAAWTDDEWTAFKAIINGDGDNAVVDGVAQDGTGETVTVVANTAEAVNLARQKYPHVMRAFRLLVGVGLTGIFKGVDDAFVPFLLHNVETARPILAESIQNIYDPAAGTVTETKYAPRVLVSETASSSDFHDVGANPGWFVTADGIIRLDGLTDDLAPAADRLYDGDLIDPDSVTVRKVRINAAVELDARAMVEYGLALPGAEENDDPNGIVAEVDETLLGRNSGPGIYEQSEWSIEHQVDSTPTAAALIPALTGGIAGGGDIEPEAKQALNASITPPLTRVYRDETVELQAAGKRVLKKLGKPARSASWKEIGIRPDRFVGQWIGVVRFVPENQTRKVGAPVDSVIFDYGRQTTETRLEGY